jgi:hypothetical protein
VGLALAEPPPKKAEPPLPFDPVNVVLKCKVQLLLMVLSCFFVRQKNFFLPLFLYYLYLNMAFLFCLFCFVWLCFVASYVMLYYVLFCSGCSALLFCVLIWSFLYIFCLFLYVCIAILFYWFIREYLIVLALKGWSFPRFATGFQQWLSRIRACSINELWHCTFKAKLFVLSKFYHADTFPSLLVCHLRSFALTRSLCASQLGVVHMFQLLEVDHNYYFVVFF